MAEFLTTKGIAAEIELIIRKADKHLYVATPYLKLSELFYDRLSEVKQSIDPHIVYSKSDLTRRETNLLNSLHFNIHHQENLHGKCYVNEDYALVTSMNLHSCSEPNNKEFGVLLSRAKDRAAFEECLEEVKTIVSRSVPIKIIAKA